MAQFTANDITLAFDDFGPRDAAPIVLVHGFSSNRNENWRRVGWYGALERRRLRGLAFDIRGHGESDKPQDSAAYARENLVGDIFALMDHAGVAKVDLMGYSMGARLALAAGLAKPERIHNLILGGIGGRLFEASPPGNPMADAMEADDPNTISDPLLRSFRHFADEQGEDRKALAACTRAQHGAFDRDRLAQLRVPTLVVAGARDALAGDPEELARAIPGARAVTLPGCDHFSAIPHALFKATVFDFLDGTLE
jgi:pimeloyl-ACP methyl ester carboxylesterase